MSIPIDRRVLETTMSMMMNGINRRKLIWNAVFNSLITKLGMRTRLGMSSGVRGWGIRDKRKKRPRSFSRTCFIINFRRGCIPFFRGDIIVDLFGHVGFQGLRIDLFEGRSHDKKGHEKGEPNHHLIRRDLLGPDGQAHEREDCHHPCEGGQHDQDGRGEREDRQHENDLKRDCGLFRLSRTPDFDTYLGETLSKGFACRSEKD